MAQLKITGLFEPMPRQLSGEQRQRVVIGRAVVREAQLLQFDEPLSNLDAQSRDGIIEPEGKPMDLFVRPHLSVVSPERR